MASFPALSRDLTYLILQFLHEQKYEETLHRLESESGLYCNLNYIEELVLKGDFDELQKYLGGFIHFGENDFSVQIIFEIQKQKYLEALDSKDGALALKILNEDLQAFRPLSENVFKELTDLLTLKNIREKKELSKYTDANTARSVLFEKLKQLLLRNPNTSDKCEFPSFRNSQLCFLVNQSLEWQHHECRNSEPNPVITTLFKDHFCGPSLTPVSKQLTSAMLRAGGSQTLLVAQKFLSTSSGQGPVNSLSFPQLPSSSNQVCATPNTGDTMPVLRRARLFEISEEALPSASENGVQIHGNADTRRVLRSVENHQDAPRVAVESRSQAYTITTCATCGIDMASVNQEGKNLTEVKSRKTDGSEFPIMWRPKEITKPSELQSIRLPDHLLPVKVMRLMYANSGSGVLALAYNARHKLWKWQKTEQNPTGTATVNVEPQLWQPAGGVTMMNDINKTSLDKSVPCIALSKNYCYCLSASGGKLSLFNTANFKVMTTFMEPPPAATYIAFHPLDNNIIAIGLLDGSIGIYNVQSEVVIQRPTAHKKCVTGLTFSVDKKILISSGADAQLCMWSIQSWEKITSKVVEPPSHRSYNPQAEMRVYFSLDQTRLLVVLETQIALYDPVNLDSITQWVPREASGAITDAVYSCDGKSVFVSVEDGSVKVLSACHLRLMCHINHTAYMPSRRSAIRVYPNAIAAHPSVPNQFALGLSNGLVYVLEPQESNIKWGTHPPIEKDAGSSSNNHVAVAAGV